MSNRNTLPPLVPMPLGDTIVVCDPFDDSATCAYTTVVTKTKTDHSDGNSVYSPGLQAAQTYPYPSSSSSVSNGAEYGRYFPGNEPVIFQNSVSPTHPYMPPVFPCGFCRREILDNVQAVHCYLGCKFWFHRTCIGLTEDAFHVLLRDPYAEWMCDPCFETKKNSLDDGKYKLIHRDGYYDTTASNS